MASEKVDPIDWPLFPTLYRAVAMSAICTVQIRATNQEFSTPIILSFKYRTIQFSIVSFVVIIRIAVVIGFVLVSRIVIILRFLN